MTLLRTSRRRRTRAGTFECERWVTMYMGSITYILPLLVL